MESNFIVWLPKKEDDIIDDSMMPLRPKHEDPGHATNTKLNNGVTLDVAYEKESKKENLPGHKRKGLIYGVDDRPPLQIAIICAFQVSTDQHTGFSISFFKVRPPPQSCFY